MLGFISPQFAAVGSLGLRDREVLDCMHTSHTDALAHDNALTAMLSSANLRILALHMVMHMHDISFHCKELMHSI